MAGMAQRDDPEVIGRRVRRMRKERGLTQRQLAEPAYTPAYISTLEAGRVRACEPALRHIAERLGVVTCTSPRSTSRTATACRDADAPAADTWVTVTGTWHPGGAPGSAQAWPPSWTPRR